MAHDLARERFHHRPWGARPPHRGRDAGRRRTEGRRRSKGPLSARRRAGVYLILEGSGIDAVRARMDTLPFVIEGLMTLDYEEIYEI
jgi:hypothetical protein